MKNVSDASAPTISANQNVLLDLQSFTITKSGSTINNNGTLKIVANKKNVTGIDENGQTKQNNYTSGRINTENKITLGNGRIEAKIKLPIFNGTFPAFWLMGGNGLRWPECGEIDIMEAVNTENVAYGTAHWPKKVGTFSDDINS